MIRSILIFTAVLFSFDGIAQTNSLKLECRVHQIDHASVELEIAVGSLVKIEKTFNNYQAIVGSSGFSTADGDLVRQVKPGSWILWSEGSKTVFQLDADTISGHGSIKFIDQPENEWIAQLSDCH
jgi:hypothetical protein